MKYSGKLFGKVGREYIPLVMTADEVDALESRVTELEGAIREALPELVNTPRPAYARRILEAVMPLPNVQADLPATVDSASGKDVIAG
jgi:hypothetical protein